MRTVVVLLVVVIWILGGFLAADHVPGLSWHEGVIFGGFVLLGLVASSLIKENGEMTVGFTLFAAGGILYLGSSLQELPADQVWMLLLPAGAGAFLGLVTSAVALLVTVKQ